VHGLRLRRPPERGARNGRLNAAQDPAAYFAEGNAKYVVETNYTAKAELERTCAAAGVRVREVGRTSADPALQVSRVTPERAESFDVHASIDELTAAWRGTLDW
jgi:hypothetical protein